ncbi:DUF4097 family beta strand repeat-containing protein [Streptomyces sp. S.PB5]|uniref:DUF4097 family beta strand repeat-containing protein n=1 Tax=Streptomyces sp. S.PB5 TaxID=3020844 RepID=UPI0025B04768|nr:DUF4097 family beta strand repeat-containing protein [Streptomyces sp. S.PB5]MDN3020361.1 DUF4097 family beta strand repeat-containing protein [Streptomyces sp. S.PB5]
MQKFDTPAAISAHLDLAAADIRLIASDRTDTTVEVLPADAAKSRDVKAAEQIEVTHHADGVLRISAPAAKNRLLGDSGTVAVTVQLPAGSRIQAKTASGTLQSKGRLGDVVFEGAQGTVHLDETAGARLTLQAGDITLGRLDGDAELTTHKGDLTVTEGVRGTLTLRTEQGNITVDAAPGTAATLDAGTSHGRTHNSLKNSEGSAARLDIHATTAYGDITARSL